METGERWCSVSERVSPVVRFTKDRYRHGDHLMISDRSGFRIYASEARKEWNGLIVKDSEYEPKHPQLCVRGVRDDRNVGEARPRADTTYIDAGSVDPDDY